MKIYFIPIIFILLIGHTWALAATDCDIYRQLANSNASDDFWQELAGLGANPSQAQLQALLQKHNVTIRSVTDSGAAAAAGSSTTPVGGTTATSGAVARASTLRLSRAAEADLRNIRGNPVLFEKAQEFMRIAEDGFQAVYNHPHSKAGWSLKAVKSGYGHGHYSVRLTSGYRVLFFREADNSIKILEMSKSATHD